MDFDDKMERAMGVTRDALIKMHISQEEQEMIRDFCSESSRMERAEALAVIRTRIKSLKKDIEDAGRKSRVCLHVVENMGQLLDRYKSSITRMKISQQTKPEQTCWLLLNFRIVSAIIENTLEGGFECRNHPKAVS